MVLVLKRKQKLKKTDTASGTDVLVSLSKATQNVSSSGAKGNR